MEAEELEALQSRNPEKVKYLLENFNEANATLFDFRSFNSSGQWIKIWKTIFAHLQRPDMKLTYATLLNTVRILTRDDANIQSTSIEDEFVCLLKLAQLQGEIATEWSNGTDIVIESLKCLCNLVFQSSNCRQLFIKHNCVDRILRRVCLSNQLSYEIDLFDMKLLFLSTALEPSVRNRVQMDLNGEAYLTHLLNEKLQNIAYSGGQEDLILEILKVLFNLTSHDSSNSNEIQNRHLTSVTRVAFVKYGNLTTDKAHAVIMHAINLLTNISSACLTELLEKCDPKSSSTANTTITTIEFEGWNVSVLEILLHHLRRILNENEKPHLTNELVPPVLTVLVKCVKCNRIMRRYVRSQILPPLKDATQPPEVGNELRNHLCRFLTLPEMLLRDLSAELLFVCCKENVTRMIKYTGYGNAAGLFASRGVLDCRSVENAEYSSDSEDSDTDEYKRIQHRVNPVTGCYQPPMPSPFEGMSDEQKEYETMQLVNLMDKLHRCSLVKPCRIGDDGLPHPVEHIAQLQEGLQQQHQHQHQQKIERKPKS